MWSQLIPTHSSHLNFKSSVCRMLSWDARMYNLTALCISLLIHSFLVFGTWWKRRIILVLIDFFCTVFLNKVVNFFKNAQQEVIFGLRIGTYISQIWIWIESQCRAFFLTLYLNLMLSISTLGFNLHLVLLAVFSILVSFAWSSL